MLCDSQYYQHPCVDRCRMLQINMTRSRTKAWTLFCLHLSISLTLASTFWRVLKDIRSSILYVIYIKIHSPCLVSTNSWENYLGSFLHQLVANFAATLPFSARQWAYRRFISVCVLKPAACLHTVNVPQNNVIKQDAKHRGGMRTGWQFFDEEPFSHRTY